MTRKPNCKCLVCNAEIYRRPAQIESGNIYCSRKCCGVGQRQDKKYCKICGTELKTKDSKITCSRACSNKNRTNTKYKIGEPKSKARKIQRLKEKLFESRGKKCKTCDYNNLNVIQVHHIIERHLGGTDDMDNLMILCPNCHYTIHFGDSRI